MQQPQTVTRLRIGGKPLSSKNNGEVLDATVLGPGDFPLGSLASRAAARVRLQHIGVAGEHGSSCICFPETEPPFFGFPIHGKVAFAVKCPIHGDRFKWPCFPMYVSKWVRENIWDHMKANHSDQYQKAWNASFPPELWPAEEVLAEGRTALQLKDGTILAFDFAPQEEKGNDSGKQKYYVENISY